MNVYKQASSGFCVWLTGLSGAGKTTISEEVVKYFDFDCELLDGDVIRTHISKGLGFSKEDRDTNIERIGWVASRIVKYGGVTIVSAISPYQEARDKARLMVEQYGRFIEVHVTAPIGKCIERDPKGLYKKAISGEIKNFTGVSDPYEVPTRPELALRTDSVSSVESGLQLIGWLYKDGLIKKNVRRALYIGRWQPFHNGHDHIIQNKLKEGIPVAIAVRDTPVEEWDPYTMEQRLQMIREVYKNDDVVVFPMPDIESVNIGRKVGYGVNRFDSPEHIEGISATQIRKLMAEEDTSWLDKVPSEVADYLRRM